MKLIDFRYVRRRVRHGKEIFEYETVLQVRHREIDRSEKGSLSVDIYAPERYQWTEWEDVPTVEEE